MNYHDIIVNIIVSAFLYAHRWKQFASNYRISVFRLQVV